MIAWSMTGKPGGRPARLRRRGRGAYRHHCKLLAAYEAGDIEGAIRTIRRHIDARSEFTRRYMESIGREV